MVVELFQPRTLNPEPLNPGERIIRVYPRSSVSPLPLMEMKNWKIAGVIATLVIVMSIPIYYFKVEKAESPRCWQGPRAGSLPPLRAA
jgi:hypothetical protein